MFAANITRFGVQGLTLSLEPRMMLATSKMTARATSPILHSSFSSYAMQMAMASIRTSGSIPFEPFSSLWNMAVLGWLPSW